MLMLFVLMDAMRCDGNAHVTDTIRSVIKVRETSGRPVKRYRILPINLKVWIDRLVWVFHVACMSQYVLWLIQQQQQQQQQSICFFLFVFVSNSLFFMLTSDQ